MVIKDKFKVGDKVKFKSKNGTGVRWFVHGLENLEVMSIYSNGVCCTLKECKGNGTWSVSCEELELMALLSITERKVKIKKIIREIEGNKEYSKCFEDVKEVESWTDTQLINWK